MNETATSAGQWPARYTSSTALARIGTGLLRSDPQLAAMLGVFGTLFAGEAMPAWEQVASRQRRDRGAGGRPDPAGQAYG